MIEYLFERKYLYTSSHVELWDCSLQDRITRGLHTAIMFIKVLLVCIKYRVNTTSQYSYF